MILKKLVANFHRNRSYAEFKEKNYKVAILHLKKIERYRKLGVTERAYWATLEIGANNSTGAKKIFSELVSELDGQVQQEMNENMRYVLAYSKMYVSLIRNTDDHNFHFENLKKMRPKEIVADYLPLPEESVMHDI